MSKAISGTRKYSKLIMVSYGSRELLTQWVTAAFSFTVFFYYEVVIGLDVTLAAVAYVVYQIWNAINDPLCGYLMERVIFPWEKKWGFRRTPLIIVGAILWLSSYLFIFLGPINADPVADKWLIFTYYVVSLCLYDTFGTLFEVNACSLFPDKFTDLNIRRQVQTYGTIFGVIGVVLAATIPSMFITTGVAVTYKTSALVTFGVGFFLLLLMLPGIYENKSVRELYKRRREEISKEEKRKGFFSTAKTVFSNKNFIAKVILFFGYQVSVVMLETSALYIITYLVDKPASSISILLGPMLGGSLISVPVWGRISQKTNNNRLISLIGGCLLTVTFIPMIFVNTLAGWIISVFFFGMALGNQWFMDLPTLSDILDDVAVKTGHRDPSVYISFQALTFKLGQTCIAWFIALVHNTTGFVSGASSLAELMEQSPTPELAVFGIRIHSAIFPAVVAAIATIIFWRLYNLTPQKIAKNKTILEEKGLLDSEN